MNEVLKKIFLAIVVVSLFLPGCVTTSTNNRNGHIADSPKRIDFPNEGFSINRPPDNWVMIKSDPGALATWNYKNVAIWTIISEAIFPENFTKEKKERFKELFMQYMNKTEYEKYINAGFEKKGRNCITTDSDEQEIRFNDKEFHQINLTAKCQFDENVNVRNRQKETFLKISYYQYLKDERMIIFAFSTSEEHYGTLKPVINSLLNSLTLIDESPTKRSAEISDPAAQFDLGDKYYKESFNHSLSRSSRQQSVREAIKWFRKAAGQGHPEAQCILGSLRERGHSFLHEVIPQDYKKAEEWYRLAANQGNIKAQRRLGEMYMKSVGVTQNYNEAIKWFNLAALQDDIIAQRNLALCYIEADADYVKAYAWLTMAAEQGSNMSRKKRDQISKEMSSEQLVKANALITDIKTGKSITP